MIWFGSIDSTTISWNTVIYEYCSICASYLRRVSGADPGFLFRGEGAQKIMIVLAHTLRARNRTHFRQGSICTAQWASGQRECMEVRNVTIPDWNVTRMKRKLTMTIFWEITIELKLLNQFQWSWYHFFQKTMFYLMKSKYAIFSNIKVTKIGRSALWGHPV